MAAIIECDIITSEDGEAVQMGKSVSHTVTWTPATPTATQTVTIYQLGKLVYLNTAGWFSGAAAGGSAFATNTSSVLPLAYWPSADRHVPIQVLNNTNVYTVGDLYIKASDGSMTVGLLAGDTTPGAFAAAPCGWNLKACYLL